MIAGSIARSPLPTSGATAFAMFEVPELKATGLPTAMTVTVPTNSRRLLVWWTLGIGIRPDRSTPSSGPVLRSIATMRSNRAQKYRPMISDTQKPMVGETTHHVTFSSITARSSLRTVSGHGV